MTAGSTDKLPPSPIPLSLASYRFRHALLLFQGSLQVGCATSSCPAALSLRRSVCQLFLERCYSRLSLSCPLFGCVEAVPRPVELIGAPFNAKFGICYNVA